jgi:hypothetical protein
MVTAVRRSAQADAAAGLHGFPVALTSQAALGGDLRRAEREM